MQIGIMSFETERTYCKLELRNYNKSTYKIVFMTFSCRITVTCTWMSSEKPQLEVQVVASHSFYCF